MLKLASLILHKRDFNERSDCHGRLQAHLAEKYLNCFRPAVSNSTHDTLQVAEVTVFEKSASLEFALFAPGVCRSMQQRLV